MNILAETKKEREKRCATSYPGSLPTLEAPGIGKEPGYEVEAL